MKYWLSAYDETADGFVIPQGINGSIDMRPSASVNTPTLMTTDDATDLKGAILISNGEPPKESLRSLWVSNFGISGVSGTTLQEWLYDTLVFRIANPLMPTLERNMDIWLANQLIFRKPFDLNGPEAVPVIARIQSDLAQLHVQSDILYRKTLASTGEKYGVSRPQDVFAPANLKNIEPLPPTTTIFDDFNRPNEDPLGTATVGGVSQGWVWGIDTQSSCRVVSNRASAGTIVNGIYKNRAEIDLSSSDMYSQADLYLDVAASSGPLARFQAAANTAYAYYVRSTPDNRFFKWVTGVQTQVGSTDSTANPPTPFTAKLVVNGSTLTGYNAGVQIMTVTDTSITIGTRAGIRAGADGSGNPTTMDNFQAGDNSGGFRIVARRRRAHAYSRWSNRIPA